MAAAYRWSSRWCQYPQRGPALKQAGLGIYLLKPSLREVVDLTGREMRSERDEELAARQLLDQDRL